MAVRYTVEINTKPFERLVINALQLHGEAIIFGIPEPAPQRTDRPVTTALTLTRVEFGPGFGHPLAAQEPKQQTSLAKVKPRFFQRIRRAVRKALGRIRSILGSMRRGRPVPGSKPPEQRRPEDTNKDRERPVIRWIATQRPPLVDGFRAAAKRAIAGHNPKPDLDALGRAIVSLLRARLTAVGGVVTGQTRDSLTYRLGPKTGVLSARR